MVVAHRDIGAMWGLDCGYIVFNRRKVGNKQLIRLIKRLYVGGMLYCVFLVIPKWGSAIYRMLCKMSACGVDAIVVYA